jgi:hypothetical protein
MVVKKKKDVIMHCLCVAWELWQPQGASSASIANPHRVVLYPEQIDQ